jgi:hypothetical protein
VSTSKLLLLALLCGLPPLVWQSVQTANLGPNVQYPQPTINSQTQNIHPAK